MVCLSEVEAMKWLESKEIREMGLVYARPLSIEEDRLGRKWLKVKTFSVHPEVAKRNNICNAEGIAWIEVV